MQTFLPLPSFEESAAVLDYRRLGKQRVETLQLLNALDGVKKGWGNHPASRMWRGYEAALARYGEVMCNEWISRGYKDTTRPKFLERQTSPVVLPPWIGDSRFHVAHQSNLLRKDPVHYARFEWAVPFDLPYQWPSLSGHGDYVLIEGTPISK